MSLSIIVAASQNNVIGRDNKLPWHLPEDLAYFKSVTMGKPILMGRKTFESIGRPLPGRTNIVITRDPNWGCDGVEVAANLENALALSKHAGGEANNEAMVIGGEQIYRLSLPYAQRLYLTRVDVDIEGDAFFPDFDHNEWLQVSEKIPSQRQDYPYRFLVLERRNSPKYKNVTFGNTE
jgi:dihydrofolate reductase